VVASNSASSWASASSRRWACVASSKAPTTATGKPSGSVTPVARNRMVTIRPSLRRTGNSPTHDSPASNRAACCCACARSCGATPSSVASAPTASSVENPVSRSASAFHNVIRRCASTATTPIASWSTSAASKPLGPPSRRPPPADAVGHPGRMINSRSATRLVTALGAHWLPPVAEYGRPRRS
jgi:hypothetical protein